MNGRRETGMWLSVSEVFNVYPSLFESIGEGACKERFRKDVSRHSALLCVSVWCSIHIALCVIFCIDIASHYGDCDWVLCCLDHANPRWFITADHTAIACLTHHTALLSASHRYSWKV